MRTLADRQLLRRYATDNSRAFALTLPQLFLKPQAMMLARPVQVHLAVAHGVERAFHPDGADIDVPEDAPTPSPPFPANG